VATPFAAGNLSVSICEIRAIRGPNAAGIHLRSKSFRDPLWPFVANPIAQAIQSVLIRAIRGSLSQRGTISCFFVCIRG